MTWMSHLHLTKGTFLGYDKEPDEVCPAGAGTGQFLKGAPAGEPTAPRGCPRAEPAFFPGGAV